MRTRITVLPKRKIPINSLNRRVLGQGVGTVLLDGGLGGQSSYSSIEEYERTTGRNLPNPTSGRGLADKISDRLSKLNINKDMPKKKNITMNF